MRRLLITWFAAVMAYVAWPAIACAEQSEPSLVLEVDVSALPQDDETEGLRWLLVERQTRVLRDGGIAVVDEDPGSARIRVLVSRYGEGDVNYRFTVALVDGEGSTVERTLTCDLCRDTELVTKVGEEVARVSGRFVYEAEARAKAAEAAAAGTNGAVEDGSESEPAVDREAKRVGPAGYAGIAALVAGAGVTVGGVIVLTREPVAEVPRANTLVETFTTHRRLGASLTAGGVAFVAAGIVLLVVDQTVLRKRRSKRRVPSALHPTLSPVGIGVSLTGRF